MKRIALAARSIFLILVVIDVGRAEQVLFVGNSFTLGTRAAEAATGGGVPRFVEAIAASQGRTVSAEILAVRGIGWGKHLERPGMEKALGSKKWDWVVLQDHSLAPTHAGDPAGHVENAERLYRLIRRGSPDAKVVFFQTWAFDKRHRMVSGRQAEEFFADPARMLTELREGYARAERQVEAIDPGEQAAIAPVGEAFALCVERHPEIALYSADNKHSSVNGMYLSALVIHATIFDEDVLGAGSRMPGAEIAPDEARKMQEIAMEVTR